ncbi:MAG: hypothetical protein K8R76_06390 [Candidatus Aegiribacteria sp.]|nr:hypothetical protein [Candidatus Aegiribacteria sp.]
MRKSILRIQSRAVRGRGAVLHASAIVFRQRGILFLAPSGGGKSTAAAILGNSGLEVLGDDSTVVSKGTDGIWRVISCASWKWQSGKHHEPVKLGSLVFLEKGYPELLERITPLYASYRILNRNQLMAYLDLLGDERSPLRASIMEICRSFPSYILRYSKAEVLRDLIDGIEY